MPPENIRRISVFGLGHRFLPGTRNSHFSRPVTTNEQNVSLEVLGKICAALHVNLGDIAQFVEL